VLDQKHRASLVANLRDQALELAAFGIVQARGRLVEQQQARLARQRSCELEQALLAKRQRAGQRLGVRASQCADRTGRTPGLATGLDDRRRYRRRRARRLPRVAPPRSLTGRWIAAITD